MYINSNQSTFNHPANYPPNTQRRLDDNIFEKSNVLTENFDQNFFYFDSSLKRHTMAFSGRCEEFDPISKCFDFENVDKLLLYLTGHGGDLYMKIMYHEILFSYHFSDFLEELFASGKIEKAFVISDTCSAGTLFTTTEGDYVKAVLLGSSEWDNSALSSGFDKYIG